jgi:long-chain acyl-CoA synthetase
MLVVAEKRMSSSVFRFLEEAVELVPNQAALLRPVNGEFREMRWREVYDSVTAIASALLALETKPGERVAIISNTRVEWTLVDLANLALAACTVPLYHSSGDEDFQFILNDSGARILFVENDAQLTRLRRFRTQVQQLLFVVVIDGGAHLDRENGEMTFADFLVLAQGRNDADLIKERISAVNPDDLASIVYTSGTTGSPKGAMLTHDNFVYESHAIEKLGLVASSDVQLIFLPLAHIFARILQFSWLKTRHLLAYAENVDRLSANLKVVKPTVLAAVPRVYEKIYAQVVSQGLNTPGFQKRLVKWAFDLASDKAKREKAGDTSSGIMWSIADSLVFSKIKERLSAQLGGRLRIMISGGAPLSPEIAYFFKYSGLTILEGWGLSETTAATCVNVLASNKIGTVGKPVPGTDVKIDDEGEILVKGRGVFKGYWNNEAATKAAFDENGYFRTGDIGVLQAGDYLKITDRKKDIIVTAGGKKVAPQKLEGLYKSANPLLAQVVVLGDNRPFCVGLFTLDEKNLSDFANAHGLKGSFASLTRQPVVRSEIEKSLAQVNEHLAEFEQVRKFAILDHDFVVGEQLTPTLKVKRKYCAERYKEKFENLYAT